MTIEVKNLSYGGFGPVTFAMHAGEVIGISGPSGCGKTRLLRALADMEPWEGHIALQGCVPAEIPASQWRQRVAYVPAESQWWFDGVGEHFSRIPADADLHALGLEPEALKWPVARLSSGEKQRLGLLRSLLNQPAVLLLDEPTAHLDTAHTQALEALVAGRCATGMMALWVAHDPEQLTRVASRGYRMAAGGVWREVDTWM
jgi:ABC-type iron transport system FetAB ATPase subunit